MIASAFISVAIIGGFVLLLTYIFSSWIEIEKAWIDNLISGSLGLLFITVGYFALPIITVLVSGFFIEKIIYKIEKIYYPEQAKNEAPVFFSDLKHDLKFTVWALFLNIIVLPLYLLGIGFFVSLLLNSYLLGREFFQNVSGYHTGKEKGKELLYKHKLKVFIGGFIITLLTLIPFINLFMPIVAVVWMVHLYHKITHPNKK